jgi:putative membrane protein
MASHPWRLMTRRAVRIGDEYSSTTRWQVTPNAETHFSWLRTRMSLERTLMSGVRTATALIAFGFAIVQFVERLNATAGVGPGLRPEAPRYIGLGLIAAGVAGLMVALWEYQWVLHYLWRPEFRAVAGPEEAPWQTPIAAIALMLALIGVFAFGEVLLRLP